jgi:primase-polymerase (primpol)-like protein
MKIKDIKSDEVRNEAVRLAMRANGGNCQTQNEAMNKHFSLAFTWEQTPQYHRFWSNIHNKITPNTPELKLPEKNPSE